MPAIIQHIPDFYSDKLSISGPAAVKILQEADGNVKMAADIIVAELRRQDAERKIMENKKEMGMILIAMGCASIEKAAGALADFFRDAKGLMIDNLIIDFLNGNDQPTMQDFLNLAEELLSYK